MCSLPKESLILRCSYLHYVEDMNLTDVGEYLGISRYRVSRYLKEARERGIVRIWIQDLNIDCEKLGIELERELGFEQALVVPTPTNADADLLRLTIGQSATSLIDGLNPESRVGITWGRTVGYMAESLSLGKIEADYVIEMAGGIGWIRSRCSAHSVALRFAEKLSAECVQLQAPIIADTVTMANSLLRESSIQRTLALAAECDVAIVGISPVDEGSLLYLSGFLSKTDLRQLKESGAVGGILGRFYNQDGAENESEYRERAISLSLDEFRVIPKRVAVGGGANKVNSIVGLARGDLITHLVTDSSTAVELLKS